MARKRGKIDPVARGNMTPGVLSLQSKEFLRMTNLTTMDYGALKIDGIYRQNAADDLMLRIKLPAGVISADQAEIVGELAEKYSPEALHLTSRGNIEICGLRHVALPHIVQRLEGIGLTTRGACGGAVRGIACAVGQGESYSRMRLLVRRLHAHFTGNPHYENLPKKFKMAVEANDSEARHLCQDLAMVYLGRENGRDLCDVWVAGGLGRQPQEAFLLAGRVPFERLLPLIEGVIKVYMQHTPPGKRLKHLIADIGEQKFRALLDQETSGTQACPLNQPLEESVADLPGPGRDGWITLPVFAGQLKAGDLRRTAALIREHGDGFLVVSREQDLLVSLDGESDRSALTRALRQIGWQTERKSLACRICPGTHGCPKGLAPTRDVARALAETLSTVEGDFSFAISGCGNSCSQPQLAPIGIVAVRKASEGKSALYDLYRRTGGGFGKPVQCKLTLEKLLDAVKDGCP